MTDEDLMAALEARASQEHTYSNVALRLREAAKSLALEAQSKAVHAIIDPRSPNNYDDWLAAGAALKATGYTFAFQVWKSWSERATNFDNSALYERWKSFPKP